MAKIEMDVSEWEQMKKYQKSLEDSLEREKVLKEQVDKLNKDKIDMLEKASRKVLIHKTKYTSQTLLVKKTFEQVIKSIQNYLRQPYHGLSGIGHHRNPQDALRDGFEDLKHTFFSVVTTESQEMNEDTVTYKGFDEVKEELRKEIFKEESKANRKMLKQYPELVKKLEKFNAMQAHAAELEEKITQHLIDKKELRDKNEEYEEKWDTINKFIQSMSTNFFKARKAIIDLKRRING